MRKGFKISLVCIVALILVGALAVAAFAAEKNPGSLADANHKLEGIRAAATLSRKLIAMDSLEEYLTERPLEKDQAGYAEFIDAYEDVKLEIANLYLDLVVAETTAYGKDVAIQNLAEYLTVYKADTTKAKYDEFNAAFDAQKLSCAQAYLSTATAADNAASKLLAIGELQTFLAVYPPNASAAYTELLAAVEVQRFDCAELYLAAVQQAETANDKDNAIDTLIRYLDEGKFLADTEGYAELLAELNDEKMACAKLYLAMVDSSLGTAKNGTIVNKMSRVVKTYGIDPDTDGYEEFMVAYNAAVAAKEKAKKDLRDQHESTINLDEYDMLTHTFSNYDSATVNMSLGGAADKTYASYADKDTATGNRYWTVKWTGPSSRYSAYYPKNIKNYVVFEFDFTSFDRLPNRLTFEHGGATALEDGSSIYPVYAIVWGDGHITIGNDQNAIVEGVNIVPGEWTNIAIMLDLSDYTYDFYVDYTMVAENVDVTKTTKGKTWNPTCLRYGGANEYGQFSLDNVQYYQGTNFRTIGKLDKLDAKESFIYYTNYFTDATKSVNTRKTAYEISAKSIPIYWDAARNKYLTTDPDIRAAVDIYNAFDIEELMNKVRDFNIVEYGRLTDVLCAYDRSLSTLTQRQQALEMVDNFVAKNGDYIPSDRPEYQQIVDKLSAARNAIEDDDNIRLFNSQMMRFTSSVTVSGMQTHYNKAKELLEKLHSVDDALAIEAHAAFAEYYSMYIKAAEEVRSATYEANAKKIVDCVGFLLDYETEEEWIANYTEMERYVLIVRDAIESGDYDKKYDGINEAIAAFLPINEYFYNRLQETHIEFITAKLDEYNASNDFIHQMGVVSTVTRYLKDADIDPDNAELAELIRLYDAACAEIDVRKEDHIGTLRENSAKFLVLLDTFDVKNTYSEMKAVLMEAEKYYFAIDKNYEGIPEAIELYDTYYARISLMERSSVAFIESVALLATAEGIDDLYAKLVDCHYYYVSINREIEGVDEAVEIYEAAYADYTGKILEPNADVEKSAKTSVICRTNCGIDAVVAIIFKKLFG